MNYGKLELVYAEPFAEALVNNLTFRSWVLGKTKFADSCNSARLLDREMLAKRSAGTRYWWRSHFSEACRCCGCSGKETDLLAIFETVAELRFALHVEVKRPGDKFKADQAAAYPVRAMCWSTNGRTPSKILRHSDAATLLLFSNENRQEFAPHLTYFDTLITFEEIEDNFPNFANGAYLKPHR
jgi:hypothetical protein